MNEPLHYATNANEKTDHHKRVVGKLSFKNTASLERKKMSASNRIITCDPKL